MIKELEGTSQVDIGRRIIALRLAMGLRPAQFADACGISRSSLSNYEKGFRRPLVDQAGKICSMTGAGLDWIYHAKRRAVPHDLGVIIDRLKPSDLLKSR